MRPRGWPALFVSSSTPATLKSGISATRPAALAVGPTPRRSMIPKNHVFHSLSPEAAVGIVNFGVWKRASEENGPAAPFSVARARHLYATLMFRLSGTVTSVLGFVARNTTAPWSVWS